MTKTYCDRCGKEITQHQDIVTLTYKLNTSFRVGVIADICKDCWFEFLKWMKG